MTTPYLLLKYQIYRIFSGVVAKKALRSEECVRRDFCSSGINRLRSKDISFLRRYPTDVYQSLLNAITLVGQQNVNRIIVDPPGMVDGFDFSQLTSEFLMQRIDGRTLVLTNVVAEYMQHQSHQQRPSIPGTNSLLPWVARQDLATPGIGGKESVEIGIDTPLEPERSSSLLVEFDLFRKLEEISVFSRFGPYAIALIENPSLWEMTDKVGLVTAFEWMGRDYADMWAHVVNVNELAVAFSQQGESIAFASIDELSYIDVSWLGRRRNAKIAPLVGTAVREGHRGNHLEVELNARLLMRRWLRYKMTYGWLTPFRLGTRTKNPIVIASLYRYFTNVKYTNLSRAEQRARDVLLNHLRCRCDADGIVKDIYEQPLPQETRQYKFSRRMAKKVDRAREGLSPKDGRIFIFELTTLTFMGSVAYKIFNDFRRWILPARH
ncbi:MAG: hypothetical protein QME05_00235 [Candidatus Margulisbacteria bacterium]|nr:hypothetical protein [Candidatus Margulisiibacteriota bacterium]